MASTSYPPPPATSIPQIRNYQEPGCPNLGKLHRFGPLYCNGEDQDLLSLRDNAWQHVQLITGGCSLETEENYLTAVGGRLEQAAKNAYPRNTPEVTNLEGGVFRRMMVRQGCFFLIAILFILGADAEQLKYSGDNSILGTNLNDTDLKKRRKLFFKSMIIPGNQIPLIVLHKLMEQSFFRDIVAAKTKWEKPDQDFLLSVLYDFVLVPALRRTRDTQQKGWMNWLFFVQQFSSSNISRTTTLEQPVDILQCLYQLVVGPGGGGGAEDDTVGHVLEDLEDDLEYGTNDIGEEDQETQRIPSATSLSQAGIRFKSIKGLGIRQIHLKRYMCGATLCLPTFNENTLFMLRFLEDYENIQGLAKREISAYLRFLSEIVRTIHDATLLDSGGVIRIEPRQLNRLPCLLKGLVRRTASNGNFRHITSANLQILKVHITQYSQRPRYRKYFGLIGILTLIGVILTLIGVIFAVLQYFKKDSH